MNQKKSEERMIFQNTAYSTKGHTYELLNKYKGDCCETFSAVNSMRWRIYSNDLYITKINIPIYAALGMFRTRSACCNRPDRRIYKHKRPTEFIHNSHKHNRRTSGGDFIPYAASAVYHIKKTETSARLVSAGWLRISLR